MGTFWQDLRYGVRTLGRSPRFTALATLTLAIGIGATTTVFSIVDTVLLQPLPYKEASRLVDIFSAYPRFKRFQLSVSMRDSTEIRSQARSFEASAFYHQEEMDLTGRVEPEQVWTAQVSNEFFDLLGSRPVVGRFFLPDEQISGKGNVAVLADEFWKSHFGGRTDVIGQALTLDNKPYIIIGVASLGFDILDTREKRTKIWLPIQPSPPGGPNPHYAGTWPGRMLARLRPGVTVREANAELDTISARLQKQFPANDTDWSVHAIGLYEEVVGAQRPAFLILLGAVGLVLLIACANVANLLLSRGLQRQKEIAIRGALGADRKRIIRQLLSESVLLALVGAAGGSLLALCGIGAFRSFAPQDIPRLNAVRPNWIMLWFELALVLTVGILSGLAPAFQASRFDVNFALKEGGIASPDSYRHRLRRSIVVVEVALALSLTIGSALLVESFSKLMNVHIGMRTDNIVTMGVFLPQSKYPGQRGVASFIQQVLGKIRGLPLVEGVAAADYKILAGGPNAASHVRIEGNEETARGVGNIGLSAVSPDLFRILGVQLITGRGFTDQDVDGAPGVAIVNEKMMRLFWRSRDPIGTHVSFRVDKDGDPIWLTVVGVVGDMRDVSLDSAPQPELYTPILQDTFRDIDILVRTRSAPLAVVSAVREQIWAVDEDRPITDIKSMDEVVSQVAAQPRFRTLLLGAFAAIGFVLAVVGIFGVVSYSVAQRTHEIGIRMALGAQPGSVLALILRHGMALVLAGVGIGMVVALALSRVLSSLLFGVGPADPVAFSLAPTFLIGVALLACYIPARRAMHVDPMTALRHE